MNRKFKFSVGEFYHIYSRGTEKRPIFLDANDYHRFIKLLYVCNSHKSIVFRDIPSDQIYIHERGETLVDIGAYCLMSNHFHMLVHEKVENGISTFMHKLLTSYSAYFNKKYGRTGSLFEGAFKGVCVDNDNYLKYLFSYIHLNPVKIIDSSWRENGIANLTATQKHLDTYEHSSYLEYASATKRDQRVILNIDAFPEYFSDFNDFKYFLNEWLNFDTDTELDPVIDLSTP